MQVVWGEALGERMRYVIIDVIRKIDSTIVSRRSYPSENYTASISYVEEDPEGEVRPNGLSAGVHEEVASGAQKQAYDRMTDALAGDRQEAPKPCWWGSRLWP